MTFGQLDSGALVVAFPIIGSLLQIIILPWVYDSPASLGHVQKIIIQGLSLKQILFYDS